MTLPRTFSRRPRVFAGLCLWLSALAVQAEVPKELAENWYRTEVLIFVRENADNRLAEQWDPLPTLEYPQRYRYLLDPALADRRLDESQSYASNIDSLGVQSLTVPSPIEEVLDHSRPDALTTAEMALDLLIPEGTPMDGNTTMGQVSEAAAGSRSVDGVLDPNTPPLDPNSPEPDFQSPIIALPYALLDNENLEFRTQARSLRRQGHRIVFHGSWWAMLDEADSTPALIMDRSGDMDRLDWPALQGSLQIYRSRYLHIVLDLWLNTQGEYLPQGWQIAAPPLAPASLSAQTLSGRTINPWSPAKSIDDAVDEVRLPLDVIAPKTEDVFAPTSERPEDLTKLRDYPWSHAIVHRQSRRMRSTEVHYLDHPVIGVIVKVIPMSDEALPLLPPQERDFRQRHALPVETLPVQPES